VAPTANAVDFNVGRIARPGDAVLDYTVSANKPGLFTNVFLLRATGDTVERIQGNSFEIRTQVEGLRLDVKSPSTTDYVDMSDDAGAVTRYWMITYD